MDGKLPRRQHNYKSRWLLAGCGGQHRHLEGSGCPYISLHRFRNRGNSNKIFGTVLANLSFYPLQCMYERLCVYGIWRQRVLGSTVLSLSPCTALSVAALSLISHLSKKGTLTSFKGVLRMKYSNPGYRTSGLDLRHSMNAIH